MQPFPWKCPFCSRDTTISDDDYHQSFTDLTLKNSDGERRMVTEFAVCPNPECKKFSLSVYLCTRKFSGMNWVSDKVLKKWTLVPASKAAAIPDYVPKAVRDDYEEACLIVDLSPKASATLARRCMQGFLEGETCKTVCGDRRA